MAVTYTQAQINALAAAMASGATEVKHGDKTVKYASLDAMQRQLNRMCLSLASPAAPIAHFAKHRRN